MTRTLVALATLALAATAIAQPQLIKFNDGSFTALAANGKVGAGSTSPENGFPVPARWTPEGGSEALTQEVGFATAISSTGEYIAGLVDTGTGVIDTPFVWSADDGFVVIPTGPIAGIARPRAISEDGNIIVADFAYWDRSTGLWESLPTDCDGFFSATDLSRFGGVAIGFCEAEPGVFEALSWIGFEDNPTVLGEAIALAASDDCEIAYGAEDDSLEARPVRIFVDGGIETLPVLPGFDSGDVRACDGSGLIAGGASTIADSFESGPTLWFDGVPVSLLDMADFPDTPPMRVNAISRNGLQILAGSWYINFDPSGDSDLDGDGLKDYWETDGIPYFGLDGQLKHYVLEGADLNFKNLYVELDMLQGLDFSQDVVDMVEDAFILSPVGGNPDGTLGISLQIDVDETDLPFEEVTQTPNKNFPPGAAQLKAERFGTKAERESPDRFMLLAAKALAYRYAVLYNDASEPIGGLGEIGGDDFALFAGDYSDLDKAAVFMHELGHCLNLRHGGGDNVNGKPNYPSIMNYVLSYKKSWNETFWRLDYSREQLATLDEGDLSELASTGAGGSGEYEFFFMPFHNIVPEDNPCFPEKLWGTGVISYCDLDPSILTDYNLDCDVEDTGIEADLNFVPNSGLPGSINPSPGQTLVGHDDWANIVLPIGDGGGFFAGTVPQDEVTDDQLAFMEENFPPPPTACAADINGDGQLSILDFVAFQYAWKLEDPVADCNKDTAFNILDFVCYQELFQAGCP